MKNLSRRNFLVSASAAALAAGCLGNPLLAATRRQRVFIASLTPDGILAYDWDPVSGELTAAGVAAQITKVAWITFSHGHEYLFAAAEVDSYNGKSTGGVASFVVEKGKLHPLSTRNSASVGTCHVALDHSGKVLLSADYVGGSAASFLVNAGQAEPHAVWTEHYTSSRPQRRSPTKRPCPLCLLLAGQPLCLH